MVALLPKLYRFALGLTGIKALAEDLVQDTIERAMRNLDRWQDGTRLDSWLYRMLQNLYLNGRRDNSNRQHLLAGFAPTDLLVGDGALMPADSMAIMGEIRAQITALPLEQREVVLMVCVEGYSYQETADILDTPVGTIRSRLARARERLREVMDVMAEPASEAAVRQRSVR